MLISKITLKVPKLMGETDRHSSFTKFPDFPLIFHISLTNSKIPLLFPNYGNPANVQHVDMIF